MRREELAPEQVVKNFTKSCGTDHRRECGAKNLSRSKFVKNFTKSCGFDARRREAVDRAGLTLAEERRVIVRG
jgi:hypothetical protein